MAGRTNTEDIVAGLTKALGSIEAQLPLVASNPSDFVPLHRIYSLLVEARGLVDTIEPDPGPSIVDIQRRAGGC